MQSRSLEEYNEGLINVGRLLARHDNTSTFTIMRTRGRMFTEANAKAPRRGPPELTIDALSIGTKFNFELLEAQSRTWASHKSVRHFWAATEFDDADPSCYETLPKTTIEQIIRTCRKKEPKTKEGAGMRAEYKYFARGFERNGAGWLCAQQRVAVALETLGRFYRRELLVDSNVLPDFMFLQDDDTYYNMVRMESFLQDKDPSIPLAESPCLLQRMHESDSFSFPWGGFGFILSRGAVANLIQPIYCNATTHAFDEFERNVCSRLEDDILGERRYFHDGMSVSDLMGAQVRNNLFTHFSRDNSNWSYCLHSDWTVGYYVNYYYISSHIKGEEFADMPALRIESTLGEHWNPNQGNCEFDSVDSCSEAAHVCHRQTANSMTRHQTKEIARKQAPGVFRNYY